MVSKQEYLKVSKLIDQYFDNMSSSEDEEPVFRPKRIPKTVFSDDEKNDDLSYYEKNKEHLKNYRKKYYRENRDFVLNKQKKYYRRTHDKRLAYQKKYRTERPNYFINYYHKNSQTIKEKRSADYQCECGIITSKGNAGRHRKTKRHKDNMEQLAVYLRLV